MKKPLAILTTVLFLMTGWIGCKQSDARSDDFITVDVTASYPKKELILQDFMDVEYIALETTDEFITVGLVQDIGENIFLIRNTNRAEAQAGTIFIFDRNGKGLRKIYRKGQGPEEYLHISAMTLDEENNEIFVNDFFSRKILVYDLLGNFKRSFAHNADKPDIVYDPTYNFDRDNLICFNYDSGFDGVKRGNNFWIISKQDGSVTKEIQIPNNKEKVSNLLFDAVSGKCIGAVYNLGLIPFRNDWILTEISADTIFRYSADHTMTPFIVRTPSIQAMDTEVFLYPGVLTDRYCFLQSIKKEHDATRWSGLQTTELVYDRQEKKTFEYAIYNDDFIHQRPIRNLVDDGSILTVINGQEIAFLEKIEAFELVEAYEKGQLKGKLKEIAAELEEESNPVLMLARYKK